MSENMSLWNQLRTPPADALKEIQAGRLRGKSDINPQWRYEAMTEAFGPCGIGWQWEVERTWSEPAPAGEVFAFAQVRVRIKVGAEWSEWVPGLGGSMLVEQESKGLHSNDEGFKMATTDAIGTALKFFGVAADVYRGGNGGSKYGTETGSPATAHAPTPASAKAPTPAPAKGTTPKANFAEDYKEYTINGQKHRFVWSDNACTVCGRSEGDKGKLRMDTETNRCYDCVKAGKVAGQQAPAADGSLPF